MTTTAPKIRKRGFTLIELLVVVAIMMVLISVVGGGALYLQNTMAMDNTIRQLKSEIQNTQNLARNSFVSNYSVSSNSNLFKDKRISLGWILTVDSNPTQKTISITKRSVYVLIPSSSAVQYDYSRLRGDILALKNNIANKNFYCANNNELWAGTSGSAARITFGGLATVYVMCTEQNSNTISAGEYSKITDFGHAVLSNQGSIPGTAPSMCNVTDTQINFFFTSGYGEPATTKSSNCQIRIEKKVNLAKIYRSILFNTTTGTITTCANYCE